MTPSSSRQYVYKSANRDPDPVSGPDLPSFLFGRNMATENETESEGEERRTFSVQVGSAEGELRVCLGRDSR